MSKYVLYNIVSDGVAKVRAIINSPFLEQLEEETGMFVQDIPEPEAHSGMIPILYINLETKELYYHYEEAPPPPPSGETLVGKVKQLEQENTLLKAQNTALSERADFIEDVIAEMATKVYQ